MNNILVIGYFIGKNYNSIGKIKRWLDNILLYLFINSNRRIVIITDNNNGIEQLKNIFQQDFIKFYNFNIKLDKYYYLSIKYHLIFNCLLKYNDNYDYICFCQSNFSLLRELDIHDCINQNQSIQLLIHPYYKFNKDSFLFLYGDNTGTTVDINKNICNFKNDWIYYQSGFSVYKQDILYWLYNEINNRMLIDFYNSKYTKWHDETYLNYIINVLINDKKIINSKKYNCKGKYLDFYFIDKKNEEYINL